MNSVTPGLLKFTPQGIYCPAGDFYIDPWRPVPKAIITHGHADHARWGMKQYLCHRVTEPVLYSRISPDISVQALEYGEKIKINEVFVSLHPAGHIPGSAQVRIEHKGYISVISGDYKVQDDGLSTAFELIKCHEFVTESTFGLPIYHWDRIPDSNAKLRDWVKHNQNIGKTSVFLGYSLGKAQRIMAALEGLDTLHVHYSIDRINKALQSVGVPIPDYEVPNFFEDKKKLDGKIIILPPALLESNIIKKIPNAAIGICSGWMQVRGSRRWRSADAGFAISDHADWNGLLWAIKETGAEKVHVTHGQTAVFSRYLNEIGINADIIHTEFGSDEETSTAESSDTPLQTEASSNPENKE